MPDHYSPEHFGEPISPSLPLLTVCLLASRVIDWHASLVPAYLAGKFRPGGVYNSARCVLAIHNLRHQVLMTAEDLDDKGFMLDY
jgi:Starch synthase catalytic domain